MDKCSPYNSKIIDLVGCPLSKILIGLLILLFFYPHETNAQDQKNKPISTYDELLIIVYMDNIYDDQKLSLIHI